MTGEEVEVVKDEDRAEIGEIMIVTEGKIVVTDMNTMIEQGMTEEIVVAIEIDEIAIDVMIMTEEKIMMTEIGINFVIRPEHIKRLTP